jgi:glycosyltransferase involved in cell wall biosynthesis
VLHIIDDASGDDSLEIIKNKYGEFNGKIKYYQLSKNRRQAYARNYAISKGTGELIAFIDQDDFWVKEKLIWQVNYIKEHNIDAVHGNLKMINDADEIVFKDKWEKENQTRREIEWEKLSNKDLARKIFNKPNIRIISSVVTRRIFDKIEGFKDQFFGGEDEAFWFEITLHGKIGYLDKFVFYRREHQNNTVDLFKAERREGYIKSIRLLKEEYDDVIFNEMYFEKEQGLIRSLINSLINKKRFIESAKWITILFIKYPKKTFFKSLEMLNKYIK